MSVPVFTRYLYIKSDVDISLLISILDKKNDAALFWAFELIYSGFYIETVSLLWRIYFEFYATLNPAFQAYFWKKQQQVNTKEAATVVTFVANIVNNLCRRKFNTDVFFLREFAFQLEMEKPYPELKDCLATRNYEAIAHYIAEAGKDDDPTTFNVLQEMATCASIYFKEKGLKDAILCNWVKVDDKMMEFISYKVLLICRVMQCFVQLEKNIKLGKNLYLNAELEDLVIYNTIEATSDFSPRKILGFACIYSPTPEYFHMFNNKRAEDIDKCFREKWLYYGAKSPVWEERIEEYGGKVDEELEKVVFENEDSEEAFYDRFGLDPDEQPKQVIDKIIPKNTQNMTWTMFYEKYGKPSQGLYEPGQDELEAL